MHCIYLLRRSMLKLAMKPFVRPFVRQRPSTYAVAIVVPFSDAVDLTDDEIISMRQLCYFLPKYKKFILAPTGYSQEYEGFCVKRFSTKFFGTAANHGKLLSRPMFYKEFLDYEYIFFYHLDSLVFSDRLHEWCGAGVDYIGSPWIRCDESIWVDKDRVGNGGFCLLRVESAIKVLTNRYLDRPSTFWFDLFTAYTPCWFISLMNTIEAHIPQSWLLTRMLQEWRETENPSKYNRNNDVFWSDMASHYLPEFTVASLEQGLRFAFEVSPKTCFKMNGGRMPFGCHAWTKYDRSLWEKFIL